MQYESTTRKTADLTPYVNNSRTHSIAQIKQIQASIKEWGFTNPVLIDDADMIIAGHGRVTAAANMGIDDVPCVILAGLSEAQKKAYVIADNRLALNAGWDDELLAVEIEGLQELDFEMGLLGFDEDELATILGGENYEGFTDEDEVPEPPEIPITVEGDIWILGNHRLMCGDSTSIDAVERLMDGQKADMVFTDPPYNIGYIGVSDKRAKIANDKMADADFVDFLTQSLMGCETLYVCCSWQYAHLFKQAMTNIARKPKAMIVWNKVNPAQHLDKYFKQHELIFYYGDFGGHRTLRGDVWQLKRERNTLHPTMKPVELIEMALADQEGKQNVFDGFGGSGSTMIACEKLSKYSYLMELEPHFCDVIVKRWQDFTGKQAVHAETGRNFNDG